MQDLVTIDDIKMDKALKKFKSKLEETPGEAKERRRKERNKRKVLKRKMK